jgi:hypothetical protein
VQADASNVFDRLFTGEVAHAVEVGCWSHARRQLVVLEDTDARVAYPLTCRFSERRDPFLTIFSKPFPPLG